MAKQHLPSGLYRLAWYALLLAVTLLPSSPAHAVSFSVNTTTDTVDANPGDGVCSDAKALCSLRAAIMEANALGGVHTIDLSSAIYTLSLAPPGFTDNSDAIGDLDVTANVTINGVSRKSSVIDGGGISRVLEVGNRLNPDSSIAEYGRLSLNSLTVRNGDNRTVQRDSWAGGIAAVSQSNHALVQLKLDDVLVTENVGALGAGIAALVRTEIVDSVVSSNSGTGSGGGLFLSRYPGPSDITDVTLTSVLVTGNSALQTNASSDSLGGGIRTGINTRVVITD